MRYIKLILAVLIAAFVLFEMGANAGALNQSLHFNFSLPFKPLGVLVLPVWAALMLTFVLAFVAAVLLEVVAWYEYTRTIRLQRRQIVTLQDEVGRLKGSAEPGR